MNKSELIQEMAKAVDNKKTAEILYDSLITNIADALKNKNEVRLTGFGTFKVVKHKARTGRNPQTGEPVKIKAKNAVRFIPYKKLKDSL